MDRETLLKVHNLAWEKKNPADFRTYAEVARELQIPLSHEEIAILAEITRPTGSSSRESGWPVQFLFQYLSSGAQQMESVLAPWANDWLLPAIVEAFHPQRAIGVVGSQADVVRLQDTHSHITWIQGNTMPLPLVDDLGTWLAEVDGDFDLIVGNPFELAIPYAQTFDSAGGQVPVKDSDGLLLLLKACTRLRDEGVGIFVVTDWFFHPDDPTSVYSNLVSLGLTVEAAIALPLGSFGARKVQQLLVIIRRTSPTSLVIGKLSEDPSHNAQLLKAIDSKKRGSDWSIGFPIMPALFHGFHNFDITMRARQLAKNAGLKLQELADVVLDVRFTRSRKLSAYEDQANAIYIPLRSKNPVVTSLSEATLKKASSYIQVMLDPDQAIALYVAGFYNNTPLGRLLLEQMYTRFYTSRSVDDVLRLLQIALPDRATQLRVIEADTRAENLASELKATRDKAWIQPRRIKESLHELDMLNKEERFADWLDMLPFPLASILWAYYTAGTDSKTKYEHVLHFFEALAEYLAIVLLSGFHTDNDLFVNERAVLERVLAQEHASIERGTFGTWIRVAERLAKSGRTLLNGDSEHQAQCMMLFRTTNRDTLSLLFSSDIIALLQETNGLRNTWSGHGGVVSDRDAAERQAILENYLSKLRRIYGSEWENFELLKAGPARYVAGVHHHDVERVMGSRTPFERKVVQVETPMEDEQLYLLATGSRTPLALLPLIKVMPSPRTANNACYFFNRKEQDGLRFVSYHFHQDADITDAFPDVLQALRTITGNGE